MVKVEQVLVICCVATMIHTMRMLQGCWRHPEDLRFLLVFHLCYGKAQKQGLFITDFS